MSDAVPGAGERTENKTKSQSSLKDLLSVFLTKSQISSLIQNQVFGYTDIPLHGFQAL